MSLRRVLKKLEAPQPEGMTFSEGFLTNDDLLPVPKEQRKWKAINFYSFWLADACNLNTFSIASSMIQAGLTWWQAWIAVIIGYSVVAPFIVLNARPGAMHHITFPGVSRTSFGVFGSMWPILNRGITATIWWAVQAWLGGEAVSVMIRAMRLDYGVTILTKEFSGTNAASFLGFIIFWILSLPTLWPRIDQVRHLFTAKAILAPIACFSFFGWMVARAGGIGPIINQPSTLRGTALGWQFVSSLMSCISNMATLCVNAPDFASRADKPSSAIWPQLIMIPVSFSITSFLGIIIASASVPLFGKAIWDPLHLLGALLDNQPSGATRFGVWFIAASFVYIQLITNLAANSISAGCDLTALFPKFLTIRRGSFLCAAVGLLIQPWHLFASSSSFTSYLGSYSVFLSAIAGVMISDYYLVRKGHMRVRDLYQFNEEGWYSYTYGINWRAYAGYFSGVAINIVGFVGSLNVGITVPMAATRIFQLSWFTGCIASGGVYYLCNVISPSPGAFQPWREIDESDFEASEIERNDDAPSSPSLEEGDEKGVYRTGEEGKKERERVNVQEVAY